MVKTVAIPSGAIKIYLIDFFTRRIPLILLSLALLVSGVILITQRIGGWGLFLGIPLVQIGFIFTIFVIDEIAKEKLGPGAYHILYCQVCGKPIVTSKRTEEIVCQTCRAKIKAKLQKGQLSTFS